MTGSRDRLSFLGILESEGIDMYVDAAGGLRARGKVTDPEIRGFIVANRDAIKKELEGAK